MDEVLDLWKIAKHMQPYEEWLSNFQLLITIVLIKLFINILKNLTTNSKIRYKWKRNSLIITLILSLPFQF
jgi:hypothetical protein